MAVFTGTHQGTNVPLPPPPRLGSGGATAASGGIGITLTDPNNTLNGNSLGGSGGYGGYSGNPPLERPAYSGNGGAGGAGIVGVGTTNLTISGVYVVRGGTGGSDFDGQGGRGGDGVDLTGTLVNSSSIAGGEGGESIQPGGGETGNGGAAGDGVRISGTLINNGGISGGVAFGDSNHGGTGVYLAPGSSLINGYDAGITGGKGADYSLAGIAGGAGVVMVATGSISSGVYSLISGGAGGTSTASGQVGAGGIGVDLAAGGTLTTAGHIEGGLGGKISYGPDKGLQGAMGDAVYFGAGNSRLIVQQGTQVGAAVTFTGNVVAEGAGNVLEFSASTKTGTLGGIGTQITGFQTLQVDSGATWELAGLNTAGDLINNGTLIEKSSDALTVAGAISGIGTIELDPTTVTLNGAVGAGQTLDFVGPGDTLKLGDPGQFLGTLSNFAVGDTIDLTGIGQNGTITEQFNTGTDTLKIVTSGGTYTLNFASPGGFTGHFFQLASDGGTGVEITKSLTPTSYYFGGTYLGSPGITNALSGNGQSGGIGLDLNDGSNNTIGSSATVTGGAGGNGTSGGGGGGGAGVALSGGGTLINEGVAKGGIGGISNNQTAGGSGGDGVDLSGGGNLINADLIRGGDGGTGNQVNGGSGGDGVGLSGGGNLNNGGTIQGGSGGVGATGYNGGSGGRGVDLSGNLTNSASAFIYGGAGGGNSSESGTGGVGGAGVALVQSGTLTNVGTIVGGAGGGSPGYANGGAGGFGIYGTNSAESVINGGTIKGGGGGDSGGGRGGYGGSAVDFRRGGTLTNAGTVSGGAGGDSPGYAPTAGDAVDFGAGDSRLIMEGGAVFNGAVVANLSFYNVLELGTAGGAGVVSGIGYGSGYQFTGFQSVLVDSGATWELAGNSYLYALTNDGTIAETSGDQLRIAGPVDGTGVIKLDPTVLILENTVSGGQTIDFAGNGDALILFDPAGFAGKIEGFTPGNTIDLLGVTVNGEPTFDSGTGALTIPTSMGSITLDFVNSSGLSSDSFNLSSDGFGGTDISVSVACYCPGTLILTPCGEVAVEDLAIGDWVITHTGEAEPVKWIGRRSYAGRFIQGKSHILPIRVRANALADGVPRRDLWMSPQHAMYLDGYLIPASALVNGISITQEPAERADYIHIELASHALIWAEGAAAETFVDDNSRQLFENADEYAQLYPDEVQQPAQFCSERLAGCYEVEVIRWRLADRAAEMWSTATSKAA